MAVATRPSPIAWLLAPALLLFVLFFVLPFGVMAMMSFYSGNPVTNPNAFLTTRHYERFIFDTAGIFHDALWSPRCASALITTIVVAADRLSAGALDGAHAVARWAMRWC